MKKVLALAVVVFGAMMAQAVTCSWQVVYSTTSETASKWANNGAVAMMFAGSNMTEVLELVGSKTVTDLKSELEAKTLRIAETDKASSVAITVDEEVYAVTGTVGSTLLTDETLFAMIFTDNKFNADTEVYWLGSSVKATGWNLFGNSDFVNNKTIGAIQEEYSSVPEAGVMGLLALGVGALALRRKVAGV